jgi:hypothetical protein
LPAMFSWLLGRRFKAALTEASGQRHR